MKRFPKAAWLVLAALVGATAGTSGTASAAVQGSILSPEQGAVLFGRVDVVAHAAAPPGGFIQGVAFFVSMGGQFTNLGFDADGGEPARGGLGCFVTGCFVRDHWSAVWNVPANFPEGPAILAASAQVCGHMGCSFQPVAQISVTIEPTPPKPHITMPGHGSKQLPVVPLIATVVDSNVVRVDWAIAPIAFPVARGVPLKNQHVDGVDASNDITDAAGTGGPDGVAGDVSCGPTAAASSLAWFADNGYPGIMPLPDGDGGGDPGETSNEELTEQLAEESNIDRNNGVTDPGLEQGIEDYLDGRGLGDEFDVGRAGGPGGPGIPGEDIEEEFQRGQDVLIGYSPPGGGTGHWMTVNDVTDNGDGTHTVNVMDPWDGTTKDITVEADGDTDYSGGGKIDGMIHVSPVDDGFEDVLGLPMPLPDGSWVGLWVAAAAPTGWYLARATATDATGLEFSDYQMFFMDP